VAWAPVLYLLHATCAWCSDFRATSRNVNVSSKQVKTSHHAFDLLLHAGESKAAKKTALAEERQIQAARQQQFLEKEIFAAQASKYDSAALDNLDEYMELLYEDNQASKVQGLGMIARLFRDPSNFDILLEKSGLLQLLSRTFREEGKKSTELAINAVAGFFSLSNFRQFHTLIMDSQVGAMSLDLIVLEIKRTEIRTREHGISPAQVAPKVRHDML
jgi:hypothetical protein